MADYGNLMKFRKKYSSYNPIYSKKKLTWGSVKTYQLCMYQNKFKKDCSLPKLEPPKKWALKVGDRK